MHKGPFASQQEIAQHDKKMREHRLSLVESEAPEKLDDGKNKKLKDYGIQD